MSGARGGGRQGIYRGMDHGVDGQQGPADFAKAFSDGDMSESSLSGDDGVSLDRRDETGGGRNYNMSSLKFAGSGSPSQAFRSVGAKGLVLHTCLHQLEYRKRVHCLP